VVGRSICCNGNVKCDSLLNVTRRWTWGRGDCGQLGHGDRRSRHEPMLVKELREVWVISADGGDFHSVACADNGGTFMKMTCSAVTAVCTLVLRETGISYTCLTQRPTRSEVGSTDSWDWESVPS
jgi:hypothetical protein